MFQAEFEPKARSLIVNGHFVQISSRYKFNADGFALVGYIPLSS